MFEMRIGDVVIAVRNGLITFDDPDREEPVLLRVSDIPLLLDFLDSVEWDGRTAFRVPISESSGLSTKIVWMGDTYSGSCLNVSSTGALIESENDLPGLSVDDVVEVTLQLGDAIAKLPGTLRRQEDQRYAFFFHESLRDGRVDSPASLRRIVNRLETEWLERRIHGLGTHEDGLIDAAAN